MSQMDYAAHFYDMYVEKHKGKHLTGERVRIILSNMPDAFESICGANA